MRGPGCGGPPLPRIVRVACSLLLGCVLTPAVAQSGSGDAKAGCSADAWMPESRYRVVVPDGQGRKVRLPPATWRQVATGCPGMADRSRWLEYLSLARRAAPTQQEVRALYPADPHSHVARGFACLSLGWATAAVQDADAALAVQATTPEAHLLRAYALLALGRAPQAEMAASRYVDLAPWNPEAFRVRAAARAAQGLTALAREDTDEHDRLMRGVPSDPADPAQGGLLVAVVDAMCRDMGPESVASWGRWCVPDYQEVAPKLTGDIVRMADLDLRIGADIPDHLAAWYGPTAAADIVLALNRDADPRARFESIVDLGAFGGGGAFVEQFMPQQDEGWLRAMFREAAHPEARLSAAIVLAHQRKLTPDDAGSITPSSQAECLLLAQVRVALGDAEGAAALQERARTWQGPSPSSGPQPWRLEETVRQLRRLREGYWWGMDWGGGMGWATLGIRVQLAAAVARKDMADASRLSSSLGRALPPLAGLTIPPASEEPAEPDVLSDPAAGLVHADLARQTYLHLQERPMAELGFAAPWCKLAILGDVLAEDGAAGLFELRVIAYHCPSEVIAYQVVWAKCQLERHPGAMSGGSVGVEIASRLAQPGCEALLAQARAYAPELFTEQMEGWLEWARKRSDEGRAGMRPDYVDVLWGDPATSLAAARRLADGGDDLGELVVWFWTTYPAGGTE